LVDGTNDSKKSGASGQTMQAADALETLAAIYEIIRRLLPEDLDHEEKCICIYVTLTKNGNLPY
jgi:hypothetical protein